MFKDILIASEKQKEVSEIRYMQGLPHKHKLNAAC
jgi:hypothetical protein